MKREKTRQRALDELINKCEDYLNDNFYKFNETNKIKISLEIIKKKMPTQLEHSGSIGTDALIFSDITTNKPLADLVADLNNRLAAQFKKKK